MPRRNSLHETTQFTLTIGVNPGYHHANQIGLETVATVWHEEARQVCIDTQRLRVSKRLARRHRLSTLIGIVRSAERKRSTISGLRNPQHCIIDDDDFEWRNAVRRIVLDGLGSDSLRKRCISRFEDIDFEYIRQRDVANSLPSELST
jgi:hypothetical protein